MHHFHYIDNTLFCEDVSIAEIAESVGTPFYLYSHATLERHFNVFSSAFEHVAPLVCYSAKANTSQAILHLFRRWGSGLDIVSGGELHRGLLAGFSPKTIVYSGVGKRIDEIDAAIGSGILMFNIESMDELTLISERAGSLNKRAGVAIRINPDVDPKTHPYISTGLKKNKFGININEAMQGYRIAQQMANIAIIGIACHIGSQITTVGPFKEALDSLLALSAELKKSGISVKYLDMGGGLGIPYHEESPPAPHAYAKALSEAVQHRGLKLILEPGRVIVGNAGILVTRVLYRKEGGGKVFVVVDAGMNDLMRPTLYGAYHAIQPVTHEARKSIVADVVGPICESGDFLAQDRPMPDVRGGELLAVMSAGAYSYSMSSNYCSRPRIAEVMVKGNHFDIIRNRETLDDLVRGEQTPDWIEG